MATTEFGYVDHSGRTVLYVLAQSGPAGGLDREEFYDELAELTQDALEQEKPLGYVWTQEWPR
jgi:hypothetical protein